MTAPNLKDWNPCATCPCSGWCFVICCHNHDARCAPNRLCCNACPERWHPEHPEGIDCSRSNDNLHETEVWR